MKRISLSILLCLGLDLSGQGWLSLMGPHQGVVTAIGRLPNHPFKLLLVGTGPNWNISYGVYRSPNSGQRWFFDSKGLPSYGSVQQLAYDPVTECIYLAQGKTYWETHISPYGGVYKSTDWGASWVEISPVSTTWWAVFASKKDPGVVLASSDNGTYRSTDGGATWTKVMNAKGMKFTSYPVPSDTVYLATYGSYIKRSTDGGSSWQTIGSGLPSSSIWSVDADPSSPNIIYAVPATWMTQLGLYRSSDYGNTWSQVVSQSVWVVRVSPSDPNIVWCGGKSGLYLSTDRGITWSQVTQYSGGCVRDLWPCEENSSALFVGANRGFFYTSDLGQTWENRNFWLRAVSVSDFETDRNDSTTIYAVGYPGYSNTLYFLAKSTDRGQTWTIINTDRPKTLSLHPMGSDTIIIGTDQVGGIYKSTDGGQTWTHSQGVPNTAQINDIEYSPNDPRQAWAACTNTSSERGIWKSTDGGNSFTKVYPQSVPPYTIAPSPADADIVLCGSLSYPPYTKEKIWRTTDGGSTWTTVHDGDLNSINIIGDIEFGRSDPAVVYACGYQKIIKSTDGGQTWDYTLPILSDGYLWDIAVNPTDPDELLVVGEKGIFHSTNGGNTWEEWTFNLWYSSGHSADYYHNRWYVGSGAEGLFVYGTLDTIKPTVTVIQPNGGEILYPGETYPIRWQADDPSGIAGIDLYYSIDAGDEYRTIAVNEPNTGSYNWLVPNTPSDRCYVMVAAYDIYGNGEVDRSDNFFTIAQPGVSEGNNRIMRPLEIRGTINPEIILNKKVGGFQFSIFDPTGRKVYQISSSDNHNINLGFLSCGLYFYQIKFGGRLMRGKFLLVR
ncbi:MAG TPA: hypothetical protein EYP58_01620 [bacterium (Candidatus Stahlbacteria)]|nr:hypothetical protein [Candidatus Stahlbacteria bacterium]